MPPLPVKAPFHAASKASAISTAVFAPETETEVPPTVRVIVSSVPIP